MSKAEEQALKAYPKQYGGSMFGPLPIELNVKERKLFIEGYKQAEQDLMDKAKQWFTDNLPSEKVQLLWCEFEQFITEN